MADIDPRPAVRRLDLAEEPDFRIGNLWVHPAQCCVSCGERRHELQPRIMKVLVALAKPQPAVVSRDRLVEMCWDGRVVGDDALNRCVLALRHTAQQFEPQPFAIETVPRVGYRLIATDSATGAPTRNTSKRWLPFAVAATLLLVIAALVVVLQQSRAAAAPASIAVLPFRSLSEGDPYFAEGIGEEILGQLAHEPQFRVAGTSSSNAIRNHDVREVARRLGVAYVVEGTVRRQEDQVRVNARLVRARDGIALWSNSYDGTLDDVFGMQRRIGAEIAAALSRKLVRTPAMSHAMVTDGKAYNLYLTARGLIRTRARHLGPVAAELLRDVLQIDPNYAPAWAALAEATLMAGAANDHETFVASAAEAQRYARQALLVAPDLPEAHRALAGVLGFGTPEAVAHLRRAAELEPNTADNMIGLGAAYGAVGEFDKELTAYRRAWQLDPLWLRAVGAVVIANAEMGDSRSAEALAKRALPPGSIEQQILLAKTAAISGDVSEAVRRWSALANARSPRWSDTARRTRDELAYSVGLKTGPVTAIPRPLDQRHLWRVWMSKAPTPAQWKDRNRDATAAAVYRDDNHVAAKLMLNGGRSLELAEAYDGPGGLIGIRRNRPLRVDQISEAPVAALALRRAGRAAEADRMLRSAARLVEAVRRRGRVPLWFEADAAALAAVAGRSDEAVGALTRLVDRGWRHGGPTDLSTIDDEPTFRLLRGHAGYERLRARLSAHYLRERAETQRVLRSAMPPA